MKLNKVPDQASYAAQFQGARSVVLEGPASYFSADKQILPIVNVTWTLNSIQYQYMRSFFRTVAKKGYKSFTIDLIIDDSELSECVAYFITGSWQLASIDLPDRFVVIAQLQIRQPSIDPAFRTGRLAVLEAFGDDAETALNLFNVIVNVNWPHV